ncbi:MAG: efflux RND transporter periplasmic adaptor subunit [Halanaerobium sp.]
MKTKSIIFFVLIIILLSSSFVSAATVEVTEAARGDLSIDETITGNITPAREVNISAEVGGIIKEMMVEIGDEVKKEEQLLKIDDQSLLIQKKQAEAGLESAEANFEELENGVTEEEYTRVKSSYEEAQDNLESAETNYELMQDIFENRRSLEQQLVAAEQQLRNAEQQLESSKENLRQAEINYNQAEREYQRSEKLYDDNVISEREFEDSKSAYENAESSLKNAENSVEQAETSLNTAEKDYQLTEENYDNPTELKQQLENARSQVKAAESGLKVAEANLKEAERGARSEQLRASKAQVKQAEASLEELEDQLVKTNIKAPFDGLVNEVAFEEGEMLPSGQTVINLVDISELFVEIEVTADTVSAINKGDRVQVKAETMQHYQEGEIRNIAPAASRESRAFLVKVRIDNSGHKLRAGMFADVRINKGKSGNAVIIPVDSIENINENDPYVYVVENGKAVKKDIELGLTTSSQVEIESGLEAGEKIVVRGKSNLSDGEEVEVRDQ